MNKLEAHDLSSAITMAVKFHEGQKDKASEPYILHPLYVMHNAKTVDEKIVGVLHDIVEDTEVTLASLVHRFNDNIIEAIDALTKRDDEKYFDYIDRLIKNELAIKVKLLDLGHNLGRGKIPVSLRNKYLKAQMIVNCALNKHARARRK